VTTWFCPECFVEVDETASQCPSCLAPTDVSAWSYEDKLVRALDHHLSDRRVLAARILGRIRSRAAVPRLAELAVDRADPYLAATAAMSLAVIEPDHPVVHVLRRSAPLLTRAALAEVSGPPRGDGDGS
jgi:hypothetical protein